MKIDKSIKVGDIVATNASNVYPFMGQRVFGKVKQITFEYLNRAFYVDLLLNTRIFDGQNHVVAYPYDAPGRPYEDAYLVKATPEECEAHRTNVMPGKENLWCVQVTESNIDLLNDYMQPLLEKYHKPKSWKVSKSAVGTYFTCPDKWTTQHSYASPLKDTKVITTQEFLEKTEMKKKSEFKYRKSVWYKHERDHSFRKCNKDSNDIIPYNERIVKKRYEIYSGKAHWNGIEADMNEVSRYLPDGHPDKVEEKNLKASEAFHDFQIGQKFEILGDRPAAGLKKGDIVTCFYVSKDSIDVIKDGVSGKPINWTLSKSTIGEYYEPYYGGGGIVEQIEGSKDEEYLPLEESKYHVELDKLKSYYNLGYDPVEEPKSMISKNDTFDPIVKAPIVI